MKGRLIYLRAPEPEDIEILYNWENDPEIWQVSNTTAPYSRFAIEQYVLNTGTDIYASRQLRLMIITSKKPPQACGAIDLFDFDPLHRRAGIGIMIAPAYRRKGYAAEALSLVMDYCRTTLNLHQVYCHISEDNTSSIRLFSDAGFRQTGIRKEWRLSDGRWKDEFLFQNILNTNPESHD